MANRTCSISGCEHPHQCSGFCDMHYRRWKRHGDPHYLGPYQIARALGPEKYFLSKVSVLPSGCWLWTGRLHKGYGVFMINRINAFAHRWAYERWIGPIPADRHMDHYRFPQDGCIGPSCCNPQHVRPVSPRENTLRGATLAAQNLAKTHCPQGHPYEGDNLGHTGHRGRRCRACAREYARRRKARERAGLALQGS